MNRVTSSTAASTHMGLPTRQAWLWRLVALTLVIGWALLVIVATLHIDGATGSTTLGVGAVDFVTVKRVETYRGETNTLVSPHFGSWLLTAAALGALLAAHRSAAAATSRD